MKEAKLTIVIGRPVHDVFEFTLNPLNTPKWVDGIIEEQASAFPPSLGTIYRNQRRDGVWNEYTITAYEPDEKFVMSKADDAYHVRYTFTSIGVSKCQLEYYEWVDKGEIDDPFTLDVLHKLKDVIEDALK